VIAQQTQPITLEQTLQAIKLDIEALEYAQARLNQRMISVEQRMTAVQEENTKKGRPVPVQSV